jgi:predicted nucleic acid-binding protein
MLFLLDANILIYGANPASPFFADCKKAASTITQNGDTPCIVPQSLYEFWTVATRAPNPQSPFSGLGMTPTQAYAEIIAIKKLFPLLPDNPRILPEWEQLVSRYSVTGKDAHDARYVAAMIVHGITHLLTYNTTDFKRFTNITALSPSDI